MKEMFKKSRKRDVNGDFIVKKYLRCYKKGCQTWAHDNQFVKKIHILHTSKEMEKIIVDYVCVK